MDSVYRQAALDKSSTTSTYKGENGVNPEEYQPIMASEREIFKAFSDLESLLRILFRILFQ